MALIVTGHARSGTTLLMRLLNDHPQIRLTRELGCFDHLGTPFPHYCLRILFRLYSAGNIWSFDLEPRYQQRPLLSNSRFVLRFLFRLGFSSWKVVTHQAVEASMRKIYPDPLIIGDKWPPYSFLLPQLSQIDGLKRLVIYRDCRDVTSSFLLRARTVWRNRRWLEYQDTAEKLATRWVHVITDMQNCAESLQIIRYENLVSEPQKTMISIGQWLNVDPQLFTIGSVNASSIGKYKSGLSPSELETVMRIAGPTMADLGYI